MAKMTKESYENLKSEIEYLINVARPQVQEELKAAREMGDLSENADYDAARTKQSEVETSIIKKQAQLREAEIIDTPTDNSFVQIGSIVTIYDESDHDEYVYTISDTLGTNPDENIISSECPLGKALMNHKVGDTIKVETANPYYVVIRNIEIRK